MSKRYVYLYCFLILGLAGILCSCPVSAPDSPGASPDTPDASPGPNPSPIISPVPAGGSIIDHACIDLTTIPDAWILAARDDLHILYGHTSHGRQITAGMDDLDAFMGGTGLYAMSQDAEYRPANALDLRDEEDITANDLGSPDRDDWEAATRTYLAAHPEINVVMWSWCGQVSYASEEEIDLYLSLMNGLEADYPDIAFVYMTGHLDGSGLDGTLHQRNEQIRAYCIANSKWLFDFADIESFNPDGVDFRDRYPTDAGNYDYNRDGNNQFEYDETGTIPYCHPEPPDRNWAEEWQTAHPGEWYEAQERWENGYHAPPLIANLKAYAAWWLFARISGWEG